MSIPVWCLLAFAAWTLLTLVTTIGVYRTRRILTGRKSFADYGEYKVEGSPWYQRAMRAHANCVENLPVFGAIVLAIVAAGLEGPVLSVLALVVVCARVPHTVVHVALEQTNRAVTSRFILYNIQFLAMSAMVVVIVMRLLS